MKNGTLQFPLSKWDRVAKIVTTLTCIFITCLTIYFVYFGFLSRSKDSTSSTIAFIAAVGTASIGLIPALWAPLKYTLDNEQITICRLSSNIRLPLDSILLIELVKAETVSKGIIRIAGSGGLYGYFGLFSNTLYGNFKCYTTTAKENLVFIRTSTDAYLLSPREAEKFVALIRQRISKR